MPGSSLLRDAMHFLRKKAKGGEEGWSQQDEVAKEETPKFCNEKTS